MTSLVGTPTGDPHPTIKHQTRIAGNSRTARAHDGASFANVHLVENPDELNDEGEPVAALGRYEVWIEHPELAPGSSGQPPSPQAPELAIRTDDLEQATAAYLTYLKVLGAPKADLTKAAGELGFVVDKRGNFVAKG